MIVTLRSVVLDTREPRRLADFDRGILGRKVVTEDDTWVVLIDPGADGWPSIWLPNTRRRCSPNLGGSQQFHRDVTVDVTVDDMEEAESKVLALGGRPGPGRTSRSAWCGAC